MWIPTQLTRAELSLHFAPQWNYQPDLHSLFDYVRKLDKRIIADTCHV